MQTYIYIYIVCEKARGLWQVYECELVLGMVVGVLQILHIASKLETAQTYIHTRTCPIYNLQTYVFITHSEVVQRRAERIQMTWVSTLCVNDLCGGWCVIKGVKASHIMYGNAKIKESFDGFAESRSPCCHCTRNKYGSCYSVLTNEQEPGHLVGLTVMTDSLTVFIIVGVGEIHHEVNDRFPPRYLQMPLSPKYSLENQA